MGPTATARRRTTESKTPTRFTFTHGRFIRKGLFASPTTAATKTKRTTTERTTTEGAATKGTTTEGTTTERTATKRTTTERTTTEGTTAKTRTCFTLSSTIATSIATSTKINLGNVESQQSNEPKVNLGVWGDDSAAH